MSLVTVIIPNYNHAPYLEQRIQSVLNQTYKHIELIILDDCSRDNSKEIIEQYREHPQLSHIVYNEKNSGSTFKQWKKGIELAKGEWIWIAESDDWCEYTLLENLVNAFLKNDEIVFAYCSSFSIRDNKIERVDMATQEVDAVVPSGEWRQNNVVGKAGVFNASAALFKKEAINRVDFNRVQQYKLCGDLFFWYQLAEKGNIYITCRVLNYCRRHETNVTENRNREGTGFIEYLDFLKFANSNAAFNAQVNRHLEAKIMDSFIFMVHNKVFASIKVQKGVYDEIAGFLPSFKLRYPFENLKYKLHKLKEKSIGRLK